MGTDSLRVITPTGKATPISERNGTGVPAPPPILPGQIEENSTQENPKVRHITLDQSPVSQDEPTPPLNPGKAWGSPPPEPPHSLPSVAQKKTPAAVEAFQTPSPSPEKIRSVAASQVLSPTGTSQSSASADVVDGESPLPTPSPAHVGPADLQSRFQQELERFSSPTPSPAHVGRDGLSPSPPQSPGPKVVAPRPQSPGQESPTPPKSLQKDLKKSTLNTHVNRFYELLEKLKNCDDTEKEELRQQGQKEIDTFNVLINKEKVEVELTVGRQLFLETMTKELQDIVKLKNNEMTEVQFDEAFSHRVTIFEAGVAALNIHIELDDKENHAGGVSSDALNNLANNITEMANIPADSHSVFAFKVAAYASNIMSPIAAENDEDAASIASINEALNPWKAELEQQKLIQGAYDWAEENGFTEVAGDGNCLFHCLAGVFDNSPLSVGWRNGFVNWIRDTYAVDVSTQDSLRANMLPHMGAESPELSWDQYLDYLRQDGSVEGQPAVYPTKMEVDLLPKFLGRSFDIVEYTAHNSDPIVTHRSPDGVDGTTSDFTLFHGLDHWWFKVYDPSETPPIAAA